MRAYMQRLSARPHHVGSPYDKDNAEWILAKFKEWGSTRRSKPSTCSFPRRRSACSKWSSPRTFTAKLQEPPVAGRSHLEPDRRAASHLQRLLDRRRRHRAAGLRELRQSRDDYEELDRLGISVKGAIVIARYGESLARHQAEGRGRARRGRLHHLFRSARRRLLRRATYFPQAPMRPADGVQRGSVMDMPVYPGDPLTPGVGATPGRQAAAARAKRPRSPRFRCCRFPTATRSRCSRRCSGPVAPDDLARRAADHVSRRTRPGEGASEGEVQLGYQAALRRDRAHSRQRPIPTSGSFAAIITTRG